MKNMTIWNIARACKGHLAVPAGKHTGTCPAAGMAVIRGYSGKEAAGIVIDSRKVEPGDIFVAIRGERVDGHQFIREVFDKGAIAVVCEEEPEELPGPCIRVEDSLAALRQIAAFYREQMPIPIVGITGSVGKTSTKEFVASVLAQKYKTHKTQGNFNNEIGVPLTLLAMPALLIRNCFAVVCKVFIDRNECFDCGIVCNNAIVMVVQPCKDRIAAGFISTNLNRTLLNEIKV